MDSQPQNSNPLKAPTLVKDSITLFGPTPGYRNTLATEINRILESESKVEPHKINKNDFSINDIKVIDIVKMSLELLEKISDKKH